MRSPRPASLSLTLVAALFIWAALVFFVPPQAWLLPFAGESVTLPGDWQTGPPNGSVLVVPAAQDKRAGKARLGSVDLSNGRAQLLVIGVREGVGFGLQINDLETQRVVKRLRVPHRNHQDDHLVILDAEPLPDRVYLVAWNRRGEPLEIESLELHDLQPGYRWTRATVWCIGPILLISLLGFNRDRLGDYLTGLGLESADRLPCDSETGLRGDRWQRWDLTAAVLVFLLCFSVYYRSPVQQILDSKHLSVVSDALIHSGSLAVPSNFVPAQRVDKVYTLRREGDKVYHFFSSAPAMLNVPFAAAYGLAGIRPVTPDGEFLGHNELRILRFSAAVAAALLCAVLFLLARVWLPPIPALGLTLVFAFGTQIFSSVSRPYWSHAWAGVLLAAAIYPLVSPRWKYRPGTYVLVATLLCWAYFCRPPLSLSILGVTLLLLVDRREFFTPFVITGSAWALALLAFSWRTYDAWLPPYFLSSHLESGRLSGGLLLSSYPTGMMGTLISPGRGLFVYVPFLILVLLVVVRRWSWIPDKPLALTALGVCLAHWQLVSLFRNWWGGQSFGPRLMSDVIPWFFVLAVLGLTALRSAEEEGELRWTTLKRFAVLSLVALSIFINTRGATSQQAQRGAGIWNWRYPSFMAGILPRPDWTSAPGPRGPAPE